MDWYTPVSSLPMVGPVYAKRLANLDIFTTGDLLFHLPFRYEDFRLTSKISTVQAGETVTVTGTVTSAENKYLQSRKTIQSVTVTDDTGSITATWFNQPFLTRTITGGTRIVLSGKAGSFAGRVTLQSPEYELVREGKPLIHTGRLVPVYPETAGVSSKWLRSRIAPLLTTSLTGEYLPQTLLRQLNLAAFHHALTIVHFPEELKDIESARRRLAFDELFLRQVNAHIRRRQWRAHRLTQPFSVDEEKVLTFVTSLPFTLTGAQKQVLSDILEDLARQTSMNRLLVGDVGSGKTVVAAIATYVAYLNGASTLFMAPTEILAQQHFSTMSRLLSPWGVTVTLQTGSQKALTQPTQKMKINSRLTGNANVSGKPTVVVGTHALIQNSVNLGNVALVVIDEQHRFGVRQRALLREKGASPHVLTMTATPIPRTIALTLYGDLDLSVINEMPAGRVPVKTWVVPPAKRAAAYDWIRTQLTAGITQQAFIVCPFITPSETLQTVKAASDEFKRLKDKVFSSLKLGLLHGRMKSAEKQQVLEKFRRHEYDILVSTPVVEVGIDIPTATIMLIEGAERYGLAQLHQLRGRVGRGTLPSFCLLFTSQPSPDHHRLKYLEKALSGPELAEFDLKIRGPGEVYGLSQHGRDRLKIASYADKDLIELAGREAKKLTDFDPNLDGAPLLKERLVSGTISDVVPD